MAANGTSGAKCDVYSCLVSLCYSDGCIADKDDASGRVSASLDVNQVKDELEALEKQRANSKKTRVTIDKELANAANNTKKIEEVHCNTRSFFFVFVLLAFNVLFALLL